MIERWPKRKQMMIFCGGNKNKPFPYNAKILNFWILLYVMEVPVNSAGIIFSYFFLITITINVIVALVIVTILYFLNIFTGSLHVFHPS